MKAVFLDARTLGDDVTLAPIEQVTGPLTCHDRTTPGEVTDRLQGFDTVLVNKVVLGREHFQACSVLTEFDDVTHERWEVAKLTFDCLSSGGFDECDNVIRWRNPE